MSVQPWHLQFNVPDATLPIVTVYFCLNKALGHTTHDIIGLLELIELLELLCELLELLLDALLLELLDELELLELLSSQQHFFLSRLEKFRVVGQNILHHHGRFFC